MKEVVMSVQTSEMRAFAAAAIGDKALADRWLETPTTIVGGSTPLSALSTLEGYHRVMRQLAWFAGKPFGSPTSSAQRHETVADLLSDPIMDIVLRRAGTGPEELLKSVRAGGRTSTRSVNRHPLSRQATRLLTRIKNAATMHFT